MNTIRWPGLASCAPFRMTARTWGCSAFVLCRAQADGGTMRFAVAVSDEMHSRQVACSAASTSPTFRCHGDVKCQTTLLPSELSPTILLLLVVADKFTPDVQTTNYSLVYQSWLSLSWSVGASYSLLDVSELAIPSWREHWCSALKGGLFYADLCSSACSAIG